MYFSGFFSCTFDYPSRYQELGVVNTIAKILLLLFFVIAVIGIGILVKLLEVDFTISSIFSDFSFWILDFVRGQCTIQRLISPWIRNVINYTNVCLTSRIHAKSD